MSVPQNGATYIDMRQFIATMCHYNMRKAMKKYGMEQGLSDLSWFEETQYPPMAIQRSRAAICFDCHS